MGDVTATLLRDGARIELDDASTLDFDGAEDLVWIEVRGPVERDFTDLQARFRLHDLAIADAMAPTNVSKVDVYDDLLFVVMKPAWLDDEEIRYGEIDAFLSPGHIITVRHGEDPLGSRAELQARLRPSRLRSDFILHAIMDLAVETYVPVIEMIEDEVLAIEQQALDGFLERGDVTRLFRWRREAIHLQHVLSRTSEVCGRLVNLDYPCIGPEVQPYFRDVQDSLARLDAMIHRLIEVIGAVFEASTLLEQQRQGAITRRLAAWAAVLGVPTAVGGVYGMNFRHMPELDSPLGYPIALAAMATACAGLLLRFRRLGWL